MSDISKSYIIPILFLNLIREILLKAKVENEG